MNDGVVKTITGTASEERTARGRVGFVDTHREYSVSQAAPACQYAQDSAYGFNETICYAWCETASKGGTFSGIYVMTVDSASGAVVIPRTQIADGSATSLSNVRVVYANNTFFILYHSQVGDLACRLIVSTSPQSITAFLKTAPLVAEVLRPLRLTVRLSPATTLSALHM